MIHKIKQRLALITALLCLTGMIFPAGLYAVNAKTSLNFDETDVMEDLESATVNGAAFNIHNYPYDESGQAKIINFVEYCYSYKTNMQSNYGLYLYIYNPQGLNFNTKTTSNKIQIATGYNAEGTPNDYGKYSLQFLSMSTEPNYYRLFYKFKIIDTNKTILERVNKNSSQRRYDVSGFELFPEGATNATEYSIGGTYTFTGYSDGYGAADGTTLDCDVNELEFIELKVKNTFYRTGVSSVGEYHENELNSVYFGVDNSVINNYGKLQKIKAEWYEYKTQPIAVTNSSTVYNAMKAYIGEKITTSNLISPSIPYGFMAYPRQQGTMTVYGWTYNGYFDNPDLIDPLEPTPYISDSKSDNLVYLFNLTGDIESEILKEYIYTYYSKYTTYGGNLNIKENTVSEDLFIDGVDAGRIRGYNLAEIDTDNHFDMLSYDSSHNWIDQLKEYGLSSFWGNDENLSDDYYDINPIYKVTDSDLSGTDSDISARLLIREKDVSNFRTYYNQQKSIGKSTYLFRFAMTDYLSGEMTIREHSTGHTVVADSYVAQETVFLDFDIIQLTFNKAGVYKVIPVVSSPIDIINSVTSPLTPSGCNSINSDSLKWIILIIIIVALLILLFPVLPYLFKGIFHLLLLLLLLPFKILKWIIKQLSKKSKKRKRSKRKKRR